MFHKQLKSLESLNPGSSSHGVRELKHVPPFYLPLLLHPQDEFHISDYLARGVKLVGAGKASVWHRVLHQPRHGASLLLGGQRGGGMLPPLSANPPPTPRAPPQVVTRVSVLAPGAEAPSTAPLTRCSPFLL